MSKTVVIGGSAGSFDALKIIIKALPQDFPAAILIVTHIGARDSVLPSLLERDSALPVRHALQGEPVVPGRVLVAPPDLHLTVAMDGDRAYARLAHGPKENHSRPAIDPLFRSAAAACGADAIGVVLSGFLDDGTVGLQAIKACGGIAVVQDPKDAEAPEMPDSAIRHARVDFVRRAVEIAPTLVQLASATAAGPVGPPGHAELELPGWIAIENRMLDEISDMGELDQIGTRVPLTCPECGGALWALRHARPLRYRCHTGHAFTAQVLASLQVGEVEEALWAAVRALHEQEQLFRQLYGKPQARHDTLPDKNDPRYDYLVKAEQAQEHAKLLRDLIATRMQLVGR